MQVRYASCRITFMNPEKNCGEKSTKSLLGGQVKMKICLIMITYVSVLKRKRCVIQLKSYIKKWLKSQILQLFTQQNGWEKNWLRNRDYVFFAESKGKSDVLCLKNLADLIANSSWYMKKEKDFAKELERITSNATKLSLKSESRKWYLAHREWNFWRYNLWKFINRKPLKVPCSANKRKIEIIISRAGNK